MVMVITRLISTDTPVKIKTQGIENRIPSTCNFQLNIIILVIIFSI